MNSCMKNINFILLTLVCLFAFALSSCEPTNSEKTTIRTKIISTTSNVEDDKELVMTIGAFNDPYVSLEAYTDLANCGINRIIVNKTRTHSQVLKILGFCDELGIDALILAEINNKTLNNNDYMTHESFAGINLKDEPIATDYPVIQSKIEIFEENYPGKLFYVNLFPDPVDNVQKLKTDTYEEYVELYCKEILSNLSGEKILSYDIYPVEKNSLGENTLDSRFLYNNELIARYAKEYDASASTYIQAMGFGRRRKPTLSSINFQVYNSLAFGFSSFYYFCYYTPGPNSEFTDEDYAIVDRECKKTEVYDYVKSMNEELFLFDNIYLRYTWQETIPVYGKVENDPQFCLCQMENQNSKTGSITKATAEYDAVVGYFLKGNNEAYMVSNFNDPANEVNNKIELTFKENREVTVYLDGIPTKMNIVNNKLILELAPGEGAFIVF